MLIFSSHSALIVFQSPFVTTLSFRRKTCFHYTDEFTSRGYKQSSSRPGNCASATKVHTTNKTEIEGKKGGGVLAHRCRCTYYEIYIKYSFQNVKKIRNKLYIYIKTFYVGYQILQEKNLFLAWVKRQKKISRE
jgi:hypothetical protein